MREDRTDAASAEREGVGPVAPGDRLPDAVLRNVTFKGVESVSTGALFGGRRAVLFGVPGAFTPTCSDTHLPGFLQLADEILAEGVDFIGCLAVNDAFVMDAWGKERGVGDKIVMLADGNADFVRAAGLELDASGFGLGTRSKRFAAVIDDGVVEMIEVEPEGEVEVSSARTVLDWLRSRRG